MKSDQNKHLPEAGFPPEMEEIRSGDIFKIPDGYFESLEAGLFHSAERKENGPDRKNNVWRIWIGAASAAASFLLLLYLGRSLGDTSQERWNHIPDVAIIEYLNDSELDIREILDVMEQKNITSVEISADHNIYYDYINENISEFEELLY